MATRKSTRVTTNAGALTLNEHTDDAEKTTKKADRPRNLKKRKISNEKDVPNRHLQSTGRRTKKIGDLRFANDVPFDVLLEIFRLLEPVDLLHFSRVSKSLHASLTSDDMSTLWKSAYRHIPSYQQPPPCPDNTNIVFYTDFLYGHHCQFCSSIYGRVYHETAFVRLCSKCANERFDYRLDRSVRDLCNVWTLPRSKSSDQVVLKEEYTLRLNEFNQAQKAQKVKQYVKEQKRAVSMRASFAPHLSRWRRDMQERQINTLNAVRNKREADIKKKLEEEGFKADSDSIWYDWANRVPHARKPRALTDSEWSLIRADILDFFLDIREEAALSDMKYKLTRRMENLAEFILQWKIRPTAWWIASSEPIASFMKSELPKEMSEEDFKRFEPALPDLITSWQEETDRYLATLIPRPSKKGMKNDAIAFELATTFFKCHWCTEPISYPRILMHSCFFQTKEENEDDDEGDIEEGAAVNSRARARGPRQPRPPMEITPSTVLPMLSDYYSLGMCAGVTGVTFDKEASNAARELITILGQDPNTVTSAELEESPERLECLRCTRIMQEKPRTKSTRLVMKWNMALIHELEEHYGEPPSSEPAWRKIDSEEDLDKVKGVENHMKTLKKFQYPVSCNHCLYYAESDSLKEQLRHINQHKISVDKATVLQHFTPPVDTPIKTLYPAVKI